MASKVINKNYMSIRVSKKVSKKKIALLADEITAAAWDKLKQKRGFKW